MTRLSVSSFLQMYIRFFSMKWGISWGNDIKLGCSFLGSVIAFPVLHALRRLKFWVVNLSPGPHSFTVQCPVLLPSWASRSHSAGSRNESRAHKGHNKKRPPISASNTQINNTSGVSLVRASCFHPQNGPMAPIVIHWSDLFS